MATIFERKLCKANGVQRPAEGAVVDSSHIAIGADLCSDGIFNHLVGDCGLILIKNLSDNQSRQYEENQIITVTPESRYRIEGLRDFQVQITNPHLFEKNKKARKSMKLKVVFVLEEGGVTDLVAFEVQN